MNKFNFMIYNKEAEMENGDYWKFLDTNGENLLNEDIYLSDLYTIINQITNENLKQKMKKKVFELIIENGISFNGLYSSLKLFNNDELKLILQNEFNINIIKHLANKDTIKYNTSEIIIYMSLLKNLNDVEFQYAMTKNILNVIKNYTDKTTLITIIEFHKENSLYARLINDYYDYLPNAYKNFLQMKKDNNYIYNKSLKFLNEDIDIGIDPRISIAPEIEINNNYNIQIELNTQNGFEDYIVSKDATVPNGDEINPRYPFHNTKEDIAKFCGLCESLKNMGYYYDETIQNAAGQINLGLDYLDTKEAILNFYEIYGNCEELLYYISNEEGQLFRQDVYTNSRIKAISEIIGRQNINEEASREDIIKLFNNRQFGENYAIKGLQYKKNSVCLRGSGEKDYRLEFRIPNGSCNYTTWIDNIRLYGKMMEVAKKLADITKQDYILPEEEHLLKLKIDLQNDDLSLEKKLVLLMNLLFKDNNIKQIYYKRYASTIKKIEETNSKKYVNNNFNFEPNFATVEFTEQYTSMLNPDYEGSGLIVTYDPETDSITSNRKK